MIRVFPLLVFLMGIGALEADTLHVTVGDTGCQGRQITVRKCFEKIPGVRSVTVLPRLPEDPPARRTFVVVSADISPDQETLRLSLGRRADDYPILDCRKLSVQGNPPKPAPVSFR